jgi:hypothetical protein
MINICIQSGLHILIFITHMTLHAKCRSIHFLFLVSFISYMAWHILQAQTLTFMIFLMVFHPFNFLGFQFLDWSILLTFMLALIFVHFELSTMQCMPSFKWPIFNFWEKPPAYSNVWVPTHLCGCAPSCCAWISHLRVR